MEQIRMKRVISNVCSVAWRLSACVVLWCGVVCWVVACCVHSDSH